MDGPRRPAPPGKPGGQDPLPLPKPGFDPLPPPAVPPFGPDDGSVLDPAKITEIQQQATATRMALRDVRDNLLRRRYGNSEPRPFTRMDGQWPFLLIRTYAGDVGHRPEDPAGLPYQGRKSPDIVVTAAGPADEPRIVDDRDRIAELAARDQYILTSGVTYDLWIHVWNLGRGQASGVRLRVRQFQPMPPDVPGPQETFLGGTALDLGDRLSERAHRVVKAATITAPAVWNIELPLLLVATIDCLSDPASGDLSPGADRHTAQRAIHTTFVPQ